VPLFQEQAVQVAIVCAGFTLSGADQLHPSVAPRLELLSDPALRFGTRESGGSRDRPSRALFLGTGDAAQGPAASALANAIADAKGIRLRKPAAETARLRWAEMSYSAPTAAVA
jgi:DNA polymerase III alpha subunit